MKEYKRTLWENNKTIVDAESLNNMEDQLLIITNSVNQEVDKIRVIEDTLPMKANRNHTHDDLANINHTHDDLANINHTHNDFANINHTHNDLANKNHTHDDFANKSHTHDDLANKSHTHNDLANKNHTHDDLANINHTHNDFANKSHTHNDLANINHTHDDFANINHTHNDFANINHTHDDFATTVEINNIKSSIENLKLELAEELKKYYDHADIQNNTLNLYSHNVLLTSLKLPIGQEPVLRAVCGEFLCDQLNCDDYSDRQARSYNKTIWQEGVTPVNASNLNKIEDKLLELSHKLQELPDNLIHTDSNPPTLEKGLWIDHNDEEVSLADSLIEQVTATIKKQQQQINELFYLTDAYLDDGEFENENNDSEILDGGVF